MLDILYLYDQTYPYVAKMFFLQSRHIKVSDYRLQVFNTDMSEPALLLSILFFRLVAELRKI